jgi:hypothetical protein
MNGESYLWVDVELRAFLPSALDGGKRAASHSQPIYLQRNNPTVPIDYEALYALDRS